MASSAAWTAIVAVVLIVIVVVMVVFHVMTIRKNYTIASQQAMFPFSSTVDPVTGQLKDFTRPDGTPQIRCPAGSVVNVIGAFADVFDPYQTCRGTLTSPGVSPLLRFQCDPSVSGGTCSGSDVSTCPSTGNYSCQNGKCKLQQTSAGNTYFRDPKSPTGSTLYLVDRDECGYLPGVGDSQSPVTALPFPNSTCSSDECATRDASANLAHLCDGKQSCLPTLISFGDLPCLGSPPQPCLTSSGAWVGGQRPSSGYYCALPYASAGAASGGASSDPQTYNIGYTYHGLYTCVPVS
jgi:hypothetical protein